MSTNLRTILYQTWGRFHEKYHYPPERTNKLDLSKAGSSPPQQGLLFIVFSQRNVCCVKLWVCKLWCTLVCAA